MSDRYAVIGNPIAHSRSPQIHSLFAAQTSQDVEYVTRFAELDGFAASVSEFFASGGCGMNVTVPFKQDAFRMADDCSEAASRARAVNTLKRLNNGEIYATNTDGEGLLADLQNNLAWPIKGKRILLIGAGGASRGVLAPLLQAGPESLLITNRSVEKAKVLADEFDALGPVRGLGFEKLKSQRFDLIINATSAGLGGELPAIPASIFSSETQFYDMSYAAEATALMQWAAREGCVECSDGLGMLVEQAAASFALWRGVTPETQEVIATLRQQMQGPKA